MIISTHIYKCAGTTLKFMFQEKYKTLVDNDNAEAIYQYFKKGKFGCFNYPEIDFNKIEIIHGHFPYCKWKEVRGNYITFLREPVSRVISQYVYDKECPTPIGTANAKDGIIKYAERTANMMTAFIGDINNMDFIGITEQFDDSIKYINYVYGLELPIGYEKKNVRNPLERIELTNKEIKAIYHINKQDCELYEQARFELNQKIKHQKELR
jgi:hypothetical protein